MIFFLPLNRILRILIFISKLNFFLSFKVCLIFSAVWVSEFSLIIKLLLAVISRSTLTIFFLIIIQKINKFILISDWSFQGVVRILKRFEIVLFFLKIRSIIKLFADFFELSLWSKLILTLELLIRILSWILVWLLFLDIPFFVDSLFLSSIFLLFLINRKIIENSCLRFELIKDLEHLFTNLRCDFLAVSSLAYRLVLIKRIF